MRRSGHGTSGVQVVLQRRRIGQSGKAALGSCDGEVNAFYDPEDKSLILCYELLQHFL